jgi:hypothetical protein
MDFDSVEISCDFLCNSGIHCLEHEALEVTKGNKFVLRTDVIYQH